MLPAKPGLNFVTAQAFDSAGNNSTDIRTYQFRVKAGQPERASWQLDDQAGATQASPSTPDRTATLHGGATPGVAGVSGTAVSFDGVDDYAQTDIPTVQTDTGFSVSAWVNLSTLPDHAAVIAAQPGTTHPASSCTTPRTSTGGPSTNTPPTLLVRRSRGRWRPRPAG